MPQTLVYFPKCVVARYSPEPVIDVMELHLIDINYRNRDILFPLSLVFDIYMKLTLHTCRTNETSTNITSNVTEHADLVRNSLVSAMVHPRRSHSN